jgi:hypothetical protein
LRLSTKHIINIAFFVVIFISAVNARDVDSTGNNDTSFVMQKSPWGAVLRSAVVPGLGQIYNKSFWKAPIVWGLGAWLVYNWILNNNNYWNYSRLYLHEQNIPNSQFASNYLTFRDFYRDQRDLFTIYMGITYFLQLVDAYVDAQLFDFSVQEDYHTGGPSISFRLHF